MEDFIRLNLNYFLGMTSILLVIILSYLIGLKYLSKKKVLHIAFLSCLLAMFLISFFKIKTQASVNNIPRSEIDKSYTNESVETYQSKVLKNSKEKE